MNEAMASSETIPGSPLLRAADGLKALIRQQGWLVGRRLPSEEAIAAQLGVSRSTLRKALDAIEGEGWVRRERNRGCVVARHAEEPKSIASNTVVVINDLVQPTPLFHQGGESSAGIQQGMIDAAHALGKTALLVPIQSVSPAMTRQMPNLHPAGLVMLCWRKDDDKSRRIAASFHQAGIPVAAYGMDTYPEAVENYDRVASDHESGVVQLLRLLADHGRKRILRIWTTPADTPWIAAHNRAYERTALEIGIPPLPAVYVPALSARVENDPAAFEMRARILAGYLAEHLKRNRNSIDSIMLGTDSETFPAAAACRILGLKPGEDILITGYDNYWHAAFERRFEPAAPFASVDKRNAAIGGELIRLLNQRIASPAAPPPQLSMIEQHAVEAQPALATPTWESA
jgi:DNA-binding LacI/PurR family transcriptional regulator